MDSARLTSIDVWFQHLTDIFLVHLVVESPYQNVSIKDKHWHYESIDNGENRVKTVSCSVKEHSNLIVSNLDAYVQKDSYCHVEVAFNEKFNGLLFDYLYWVPVVDFYSHESNVVILRIQCRCKVDDVKYQYLKQNDGLEHEVRARLNQHDHVSDSVKIKRIVQRIRGNEL